MARMANTAIDNGLTGIFATLTNYYLSLHTADPGTTGANEVTGGSYARQAIQFAAPSAGTQSSNTSQSFTNMPAEPTGVPYCGVWTAASGGTFLWGGLVSGGSGAITGGSTVAVASGGVSAALA